MKTRCGFVLLATLMVLAGCGLAPGPIETEQVPGQVEAGRLRNQGDGSCLDVKSGKLWQVGRSRRITSLAAAEEYVQALDLAGHDDWRLPRLAELYELFLLFDSGENGDCHLDFEGNYWSGDVDTKGRVGAWELDGDCHPEREYVPKEAGYIRAVRP